VLRRLAFMGARHGPSAFVRFSPPMFGALFALALPDLRSRVLRNLRAVRGIRAPLGENRDVMATFADYASCFAESLGAERRDGMSARIAVVGGDHLRRVLAEGRGAVLVTAHVGPWDIAASLLSRDLGANVAIVMDREPDAEAQALHDAVRSRKGVTVLSIGETELDALPVLRHLKRGGLVAFQLDRAPPSARVLTAELFGRAVRVPEGPFSLSSIARVPVVPLFAFRQGYYSYGVEVFEPIEPVAHAGRDALGVMAERALRAMERFVRAHPTQWFDFGE
jgi:lauroyl/myristoyl acyltransferase